jgi:hypothetical protein
VVNLPFAVIAPAVLASVEFVITPKTIRYQMAVCNDEISENESVKLLNVFNSFGWVAQLVEQRTENPCVGGSIPPPATTLDAWASMGCEGTSRKLSAKLSAASELGETPEVPAKTPPKL